MIEWKGRGGGGWANEGGGGGWEVWLLCCVVYCIRVCEHMHSHKMSNNIYSHVTISLPSNPVEASKENPSSAPATKLTKKVHTVLQLRSSLQLTCVCS